MWEKIKKVFSIISAVLSVLLFTVLLSLLRRSNTDGQGSTRNAERDTKIKDGFKQSSDTVRRCEEHLQRAESILRNAINKSKSEERKS